MTLLFVIVVIVSGRARWVGHHLVHFPLKKEIITICGVPSVLGSSDDSQAKRVLVLELSPGQFHFPFSLIKFPSHHVFVFRSSSSILCMNLPGVSPRKKYYGGLRRWYNPSWFSEAVPSTPYDPLVLRRAFEDAVIKRLMTDVPFGVLLSGGLDSSLVASVTARYMAGTKAAKQWGAQLHSFCVGLEGSPDLKAAREVADYLGTVHHEFTFTVQDGIDAIEDVIYHIETYDVTTIRASTPMFLMSRKIKALGVKMVISGEGADEIFGGYLYFHKAPNKEEFHQETCQKIKALHQYDCLRANKSTSAWGLEARVPFLDKEFIKVAMDIDPEWKMIKRDEGRIEKWILRRAFDDEEHPYLPKHILYRQKEQFSDGVGYSWIDGLKAHTADHVTDRMNPRRQPLSLLGKSQMNI
ncbi:asparagine synthetase [glutamine-hydrolyzing]-like [Papaver somniferum]|uniref:asparagine synthetase [glutamine-hydrolyzing]-like n=1 Tax=Papaver somniferum TaxID=3469 RepID=UPI000E6FB70D|nr:asparagine synthetase [glutamine-hydrolyzing]-like [Papaver somniferum]